MSSITVRHPRLDTRRLLPASACLVASFGLVSCSGGDADAVDTTAATDVQESVVADDVDPTESADLPEVTVAVETTTTAAPVAETLTADPDGDCLTGEWSISGDEMKAYFDAVFAATDFGVAGTPIISVAGSSEFVLDGAEFTYTPDFIVTVSLAGFDAIATPSGEGHGSYVPSGGLLRATVADSDLELVVELDGTVIDASAFGEGIFSDTPFVDGPYDCAAGPTIGLSVGADGTSWHPVTLTPA